MNTHDCNHHWKIQPSDWDDLPEEVTGCATCAHCGRQEFVYTCDLRTSPRCKNQVVSGEDCPQCSVEEQETVEAPVPNEK